MSASREKKTRQEQSSSGMTTPQTAHEAKQRKEQKRSSILYGTIAVLFVIAAVIAIVWRSNVIPKNASAVTIDGEKYTASEVNFYYQNSYMNFLNQYSYLVSYLGLNPQASLKGQEISEQTAAMLGIEPGQTWHDFFLDAAMDQMAGMQNALAQAESEGFEYPASVQTQFEDSIASLNAAAAANGISATTYLQANFGAGMTQKVYETQLMNMLRYSAYVDAYTESLTYSDAELEEAYGENTNTYDTVSYEVVNISGAAAATEDDEGNTVEPTEEDETAAMEAAKAAADKMLSDYKAGGDLEALAEELEGAEYTKNEKGTHSGNTLTEWLFDEARKAGDSAVLESGSTYYVAVFHDRTRDESKTIDIRHILIKPAAGTLSKDAEGYEEEQAQLKADAKAQAEDLLAQWTAGEATEDAFAALAMEHSADGSKYVGGLYREVYQGQMVETFNDWCFDEARVAGDTGIVETQYGYHVMYFVGDNAARWQTQVAANLRNEAVNAWSAEFAADYSADMGGFGMKFVG